ncbi:hypothetical protein PVA17_13140 [Lysinibacillus sp. CNPSo 3705]|uniref:hypothetical protein n=1 Tax=Lysinibacillus sp. CNPSo 3705 TaxID=3028148 RepID=UPI002364324B|nr:hypothetical protein [Lysinibacillus sp. CNPSo 3705]MDD1503703.1 hypothetical protein [Lysinibacillus sp. CNPSo 3705]
MNFYDDEVQSIALNYFLMTIDVCTSISLRILYPSFGDSIHQFKCSIHDLEMLSITVYIMI